MPNKIDALLNYHDQLKAMIIAEVDRTCIWPNLTGSDQYNEFLKDPNEIDKWQARASFAFTEARSQGVHRISGRKGFFSPDTLIVPFALMGAYNAYTQDNIEECLNIKTATNIAATYSQKSEDTVKRMIHRNTGPDKLFDAVRDGRNVFLIPTPTIRRTHFIAALVRVLDRQICEPSDLWGGKFNHRYWTEYLKFDKAIYDFALTENPPDSSNLILDRKSNKHDNITQIASSFGD